MDLLTEAYERLSKLPAFSQLAMDEQYWAAKEVADGVQSLLDADWQKLEVVVAN